MVLCGITFYPSLGKGYGHQNCFPQEQITLQWTIPHGLVWEFLSDIGPGKKLLDHGAYIMHNLIKHHPPKWLDTRHWIGTWDPFAPVPPHSLQLVVALFNLHISHHYVRNRKVGFPPLLFKFPILLQQGLDYQGLH